MDSKADAVETLSEAFLASSDDGAKEAVLDGGTQSFVVGRNALDGYAEHLRMQGIGWTPKTYVCGEMLRFRNEATSRCTTSTVILVSFAGRTGHLHVYVLPGPRRA